MKDAAAVWKFPAPASFGADGTFMVLMPAGSVPVSCQQQRGDLMIWAMVAPKEPQRGHRFRIVMTGEEFPQEHLGKFLATVQLPNGIVAHLFYLGER